MRDIQTALDVILSKTLIYFIMCIFICTQCYITNCNGNDVKINTYLQEEDTTNVAMATTPHNTISKV